MIIVMLELLNPYLQMLNMNFLTMNMDMITLKLLSNSKLKKQVEENFKMKKLIFWAKQMNTELISDCKKKKKQLKDGANASKTMSGFHLFLTKCFVTYLTFVVFHVCFECVIFLSFMNILNVFLEVTKS